MSDRVELGDQVGDYRVTGEIGRGGMGIVYLGEHMSTGQPAALKFLPPELIDDEDSRRRFAREATYAASLDHPHIVALYEAGETDGVHYMAMQYVPGGDLRELLAREGELHPERAVALLAQVADALDAAHAAGILHRDLKPENVLIAHESDGTDGADHCYLTDFGLSKNSSQDSVALTAKGSYVGTFHYTAPEMIIGTEVDHRVDVYSLGCLLYQCLIGEPPFPGAREVEVLHAHLRQPPPRPSDRRPELPAALDDVIAAAMAKEPDGRPDSCRAVIEAARAAIAGLRIEPPVAAPPLRRVTQEPDAGPRAGVEAGVDPGEPPTPVGQISLEVTAGNAVGTVIDVADELLVGRSADGVGRLADDVEISRRHARIFRTPGGRYAVEDLVSTNGTYVNGRRITDVTPLEVGDWMDIGATTLVVRVCVPGPAVALPVDPEPGAAAPPPPDPTGDLEPADAGPVEAVEDLPPTSQVAPPLRAPADLPEDEPAPLLRTVDDVFGGDLAPVAAPASVGVEVPADAGGETAPLSLRLEIDLPGRSVRIHLDEESEPISFVYRDGRWRSADTG
jgi:serine/threonine-protein kinase